MIPPQRSTKGFPWTTVTSLERCANFYKAAKDHHCTIYKTPAGETSLWAVLQHRMMQEIDLTKSRSLLD